MNNIFFKIFHYTVVGLCWFVFLTVMYAVFFTPKSY